MLSLTWDDLFIGFAAQVRAQTWTKRADKDNVCCSFMIAVIHRHTHKYPRLITLEEVRAMYDKYC